MFAVQSALFLLKKADDMTSSLMVLESLLDGRAELDQTQIGGICALLGSVHMAYGDQVAEHHESIDFLTAFQKKQFELSKANYHAMKAA
jgi:hypothetical protein